jgi:hypothetical protein
VIELVPWSEADLPVLAALNTPEQKKHLGGPESEERLMKSNRDYAQIVIPGEVRMFRIEHEGSPHIDRPSKSITGTLLRSTPSRQRIFT